MMKSLLSMGLSSLACTMMFTACAQAQPPNFGEREDRGLVEHESINEASGMASSRINSGVLWTHNDSGDSTRVFAMTTSGRNLGEFYLRGAQARDWEDMTIGPGPEDGRSYLYVGEIGDNAAIYDTKYIYRVPEPLVDSTTAVIEELDGVETISFRYPDGARDAEALMVDPVTRDLYVVSKREGSVRIYKASYPQSTEETITLERVGTLQDITFITAGSISPDGDEILLKTYTTVYYWKRESGESVENALAREPIVLPYVPEPQGEAITWDEEGSGYYTLSEEAGGIPARIYYFPRLKTSSVEGRSDSRSTHPDISQD